MSVLICSTKYDGCGYIGEGRAFGMKWDRVICPQCHQDHAFQLTDENFERLVDESNRDKARKMLDKENATVHGDHLKFCVKEGYIKNLTEEQKKELGFYV